MKKFFMLLVIFVAWTGFAAMGGGKVYLEHEEKTLPEIDVVALKQSSASTETKIFTSSGNILDTFSLTTKIPVSINDIPVLLQDAFMSAEDRNFLKHHGVDYPSVFRAGLKNVLLHRHEGGSGITQQVVKNLITGNERSLDRKIKEALLAQNLEHVMTKSEIMSVYLNSIWFGHGAYGIGAASKVWFHKDVRELTVPEMAFLAGLPKGPALMEPSAHPERARARRLYVLTNMVSDGYISKEEADKAAYAPLPTPVSITNTGTGHNYYSENVRRELVNQQGQDAVYSGGMNIQTWYDEDMQKVADEALRNGLLEYDRRHGWNGLHGEMPTTWRKGIILSCNGKECLVDARDVEHPRDDAVQVNNPYGERSLRKGSLVYIENNTIVRRPDADGAVVVMSKEGHILAESGGFWRGQSLFDRATQSRRQTGSVIKPFIALASLSHGWKPETIVADVPVEIDVDGKPWTPGGDGHDDGMGMISLRQALALSRNQAFVRLGMDVGFPEVYDLFHTLGLYEDTSSLSPASMLGASETSLMKMTAAYATLVQNGSDSLPHKGCPVKPQFIVSLQDDETCMRTIDNTSGILDMLHAVVSGGTAEHAFMGLPEDARKIIGGKTGTSNNVLDSWFVGYVGDIVVGVHVGMDTPQSLGEHEFGGTIAAPIAASIMKSIWETKYSSH